MLMVLMLAAASGAIAALAGLVSVLRAPGRDIPAGTRVDSPPILGGAALDRAGMIA
jgi:hypothetical protein